MNAFSKDKEQITPCIASIETNLPVLDARIADAESLLASLRQQRQSVIDRANAYKRLLSPIHRLPVEILSEIFQLYYHRRQWVHESNGDAWTLCHVCKLWNTVATGIPSLWSEVNLSFPSSHMADAASAQLLKAIARGNLVDVAISPKQRLTAPISEVFHDFPGAIHSISLTNIDPIHYSSALFPFSLMDGDAAVETYSQLRQFRVYVDGERCPGMPFQTRNQFNPALLPIPWSQLTHIEFDHGMNVDLAATTLASFTSVVQCSLTLIDSVVPLTTATPRTAVNLKALTSLRLVVLCTGAFSWFFDSVTLPSLQYMKLELNENPEDVGNSYLELKTRSSLNLQFFDVQDAFFTSGALIEFLQDMSSLQSIGLLRTENCVSNELIDALSLEPGKKAPRLEEFEFQADINAGIVDVNRIVDMLESRCPPDTIHAGECNRFVYGRRGFLLEGSWRLIFGWIIQTFRDE